MSIQIPISYEEAYARYKDKYNIINYLVSDKVVPNTIYSINFMAKVNNLLAYIVNKPLLQIENIQYGGDVSILNFLNPTNKTNLKNMFRTLIKTSANVGAEVATLGMGGDIFINVLFALHSTASYLQNIRVIYKFISKGKLFENLIKYDPTKKPKIYTLVHPISLKKSDLDLFRTDVTNILDTNTQGLPRKYIRIITNLIKSNMNKMTIVISDWISCFFPDTAGLVGEVARQILNKMVEYGLDNISEITKLLPESMLSTLVNEEELDNSVKNIVQTTKKIIAKADTTKIADSLSKLTDRWSLMANRPEIRKLLGTVSGTIPNPKTILLGIMKKTIEPNIDNYVSTFYHTFITFLIMTIMLEYMRKLK
jgi:hypothetical protein